MVDDSADNQYLMKCLLSREGAEVKVVGSGEDALSASQIENFDFVFLDIQMPGMNGIEAVTELRRKGYLKPIIAFTANALSEDRNLCLKAGFNHYITKPIDRKELLGILVKYSNL